MSVPTCPHYIDSHRVTQRENALLESPTGTGKTLALLCSSIAWLGAYKRFQVNDRGSTGAETDLQKPALPAIADKPAAPVSTPHPALMPPPTPSFTLPAPASANTERPAPMLAIKADAGEPIKLQDDINEESDGIEITFESTPKSQKHEHDDDAPKSKFKKFIEDSKSVRLWQSCAVVQYNALY